MKNTKKLFSMPLCLAIVLVGGTAGCSLFGPEPEGIVVPGVIGIETASTPTDVQSQDFAQVAIAGHIVSVPRSFPLPPWAGELYEGTVEVRAGVPFDVTVHTWASSSHRAEESVVLLGPSRAVIYVFDTIPPWAEAITLDLILLPRTDTIVFSEPGEAEVVIRGKLTGSITGPHPFELRFPVIVTE